MGSENWPSDLLTLLPVCGWWTLSNDVPMRRHSGLRDYNGATDDSSHPRQVDVPWGYSGSFSSVRVSQRGTRAVCAHSCPSEEPVNSGKSVPFSDLSQNVSLWVLQNYYQSPMCCFYDWWARFFNENSRLSTPGNDKVSCQLFTVINYQLF